MADEQLQAERWEITDKHGNSTVCPNKEEADRTARQYECWYPGRAPFLVTPIPPPSRDLNVDELRESLKDVQQMIHEVTHAQSVGPDWYTRGESGLYMQVYNWLQKGQTSLTKAHALIDSAGGAKGAITGGLVDAYMEAAQPDGGDGVEHEGDTCRSNDLYAGNSVGWWKSKADNYKNGLLKVCDALGSIGVKMDGNTPCWEYVAALTRPSATAAVPKVAVPDGVMEARAQGRAEALAIVLQLEAESGLDDYVDSVPPGPSGEWGSAWNEAKLRELFRADDTAWSLLQEAEGEFWHNMGLREEAQRIHALAAAPAEHPLVTRFRMLVSMLRAEASCRPTGLTFGEQAANARSGEIADKIETAIHEVAVLGKSHPQTAEEAERCREALTNQQQAEAGT